MKRAIDLAAMGTFTTRPNPMVGAVIVYKDKVIGEAYHRKAGEAHAEVLAVKSAPEHLLHKSTIYVSLEPCSHFGRTPPCADLLAEKGFKRVVIGAKDTSAKVSGKGIAILKKAGCEVDVGILEEECRALNRRFFTYHEKGRPFIILKWAESADGFIDKIRNENDQKRPNWITGEEEQKLVHRWRAEEHAILVGANTLRMDNPELTTRLWPGENPLRVLLAGSKPLPKGLKLLEDDKPTLVFSTGELNLIKGKENIVEKDLTLMLKRVLDELYKRDIQSLIVEGGANILMQFIRAGLWDEARVFQGKSSFGAGIAAPVVSGKLEDIEKFENSKLSYVHP